MFSMFSNHCLQEKSWCSLEDGVRWRLFSQPWLKVMNRKPSWSCLMPWLRPSSLSSHCYCIRQWHGLAICAVCRTLLLSGELDFWRTFYAVSSTQTGVRESLTSFDLWLRTIFFDVNLCSIGSSGLQPSDCVGNFTSTDFQTYMYLAYDGLVFLYTPSQLLSEKRWSWTW